MPTPDKVDVFGTDITLLGRAYPNKAETGPCRIHLYAVLASLGIKLSDPRTSCSVYQQLYLDISLNFKRNVSTFRCKVTLSI